MDPADGPSALRAWQTLEGRADVGIPDDLEAQLLALHAPEVDEPRWRRDLARLDDRQAPLGGDIQAR